MPVIKMEGSRKVLIRWFDEREKIITYIAYQKSGLNQKWGEWREFPRTTCGKCWPASRDHQHWIQQHTLLDMETPYGILLESWKGGKWIEYGWHINVGWVPSISLSWFHAIDKSIWWGMWEVEVWIIQVLPNEVNILLDSRDFVHIAIMYFCGYRIARHHLVHSEWVEVGCWDEGGKKLLGTGRWQDRENTMAPGY